MANPFLDELLDPCMILSQTSWSEGYDVDIVETSNGAESRRLRSALPRARLSLGYISTRDDLGTKALSLYRRAYGTFAGFRVKHPDDYTTNADGVTDPTNSDQTATPLTATTWQLEKTYPGSEVLGIGAPVRTIYKPVDGTLLVAGDAVAAVEDTDYTVDYSTGIVTWIVSPAPTVVTFGCQFHYPMRYASALDIQAESDTIRGASAELIEDINPL